MEKLNARVTTQAIIVNNANQVLLLKRNRPGGLYTLPGGTIHQGEEVKAGLKRELEEETGLRLTVGDPVWIWQSNHTGKDLLGIVFTINEVLTGSEVVVISEEHSASAWFSKADLFASEEVDPFIKRDELNKIWQ